MRHYRYGWTCLCGAKSRKFWQGPLFGGPMSKAGHRHLQRVLLKYAKAHNTTTKALWMVTSLVYQETKHSIFLRRPPGEKL